MGAKTIDAAKLIILAVLLVCVVGATVYFANDVGHRAEERIETLRQQLSMLTELESRTKRIEEDTRALRERLQIVRKEAKEAAKTASAAAEAVGVDATGLRTKADEPPGKTESGGLFGIFGGDK